MSGPAAVELRLLGRFVVSVAGTELPSASFGGRKVRTLLRILATRQGHFVTHDELAEALWESRPPVDPVANLQVLVNRARRAVDRAALVLTGPGGYALADAATCRVDTEEFLAAVTTAEARQGRAALRAYQAALAASGGEPLAEDRYAEWSQPYRIRFLRQRQTALEQAAGLALQCGEHPLAVEYASAAVAADPLRENATVLLVRALAAVGDPAGALAQYDVFRRLLADELGLDPSPAAAAVQADLLRHGDSTARTTRLAQRPPEFAGLPFVGRTDDHAALAAALHRGGLISLTGQSGVGKSRLVAEIVTGGSGLSMPGPTLSMRASWSQRTQPFGVARQLFDEILAADVFALGGLPDRLRAALTDVVPDLSIETGGGIDLESRRALLIEAAVRVVAVRAPLVLVVDDAHWVDASSVQLLGTLADRVDGIAVLLVLRPDEIPPGGELPALLSRLEVDRRIVLTGLSRGAVAELIAGADPAGGGVADADPAGGGLADAASAGFDHLADGLVNALWDSTDRTPFAIGEVLRELAAEGLITPTTAGRWTVAAPETVTRANALGLAGQRRAIATRVSRIDDATATILALLALRGGECTVGLLAAAVSTAEPAVVDSLGRLARQGLARATESGWVVAHDLIGEVVVAGLGPDTRVRCHGLLAAALARGSDAPAELAEHWLGAGDSARAAEAYAAAAQQALQTFADREAAALADSGLAIRSDPVAQASLWQTRAEARRRLGDMAGARDDLREALAVLPSGPPRAVALARLALLASGSDDLVRASALAELALIEAGESAAGRAWSLEVASVIDMNLGRPQRARTRADEAFDIYQHEHDSGGAARVLDARAMATFLAGEVTTGTRLLRQAADLFEDSGDLARLVTPRSTCGHGLVFGGRADAGLGQVDLAWDTARALGHPEAQAYVLWHRSEALSSLGRAAEAMADAREALALSTRIGHRGWTATAWRAVGIAEQAAGDLDAALASFEFSLQRCENLELFGSWAAARCAMVLTAMGRTGRAADFVERALATGPPLGHYEARLAAVELAAALGDGGAGSLAVDALRRAEAGGVAQHTDRLRRVAAAAGVTC